MTVLGVGWLYGDDFVELLVVQG